VIRRGQQSAEEAGSEDQLLKEIQTYDGKVVVGHDLDIY
jgi:hypothetical protein